MRQLQVLVLIITTILNEIGSSFNDVVDTVKDQEYPVYTYVVQTRDGYLLDLFRIPGSTKYLKDWENSEKKYTGKPAVFLMHGLLGSAHEFLAGGRKHGLAYILADHGFDVFLGNARGNRYSRKHIYFDPDVDDEFWKFSWDQIALYDLPAIIEKIVNVTGKISIDYIGFNQGTTVYYAMASRIPELNARINKVVALGPMVLMEHGQHPLMSLLKSPNNRNSLSWISKNLGRYEFLPSKFVKDPSKGVCLDRRITYEICNEFYFLINGYSTYIDVLLANDIATKQPYGISTAQLLHYADLIYINSFAPFGSNTGNIKQCEENHNDCDDDNVDAVFNLGNGENYNLSTVSSRSYLFYVRQDFWTDKDDIENLAKKLPKEVKLFEFPNYDANIDLLLSTDAHEKVFKKILNILLEE